MERVRRRNRVLPTALALVVAVLSASCAAAGQKIYTKDNPPPAIEVGDLKMTDSVSQYGITWTLDHKVPVGRFINGDYYVVGPVTVVDITPRPTLDLGGGTESREALDSRRWMSPRTVKVKVQARNGSMLNLQVEKEKTGFDSRAPGNRFDARLFTPLPIKMVPGDSLVSTISTEKVRTVPRMLNPEGVRKTISPVNVAAVLTCMDRAVPADAFRPSPCDKSNKIYLARNLRRDLLSSLPRPKGTAGLPRQDVLFRVMLAKWDVTALKNWERVYQRPWIDTVEFEFCQPTENMPDYGREIARAAGITTLLLNCDFKPREKEKLLVNFVQVGIDLWGAVRAGLKGWPAVGGHGIGRKWIIVFSGIMLGDKDMQSPETKYPKVRFSEDEMTEYSRCWTGAGVVFTGINGRTGKGARGPYEHLHPSRWLGTINEDYRRSSTSSSWVGQALAAHIMHAEKLWNHDAFFSYVDRWMTEDDSQQVKDIKEATGKDYSEAYLRQKRSWDPFVNEMWAKYRTSKGLAPLDVPVAKVDRTERVTIGRNREFRVAGKLLLPLMLFGQGPAQIDDAVAVGVNTFIENGGQVSNRELLDALAKRGLYGVLGADMKIIDRPNLLGLLHLDQPDMFKILRDVDVTAGQGMYVNSDFPLERLVDGDKTRKAILGPLEGAQVTLKRKEPVTVQSLAVWLGDYKGFSVAREVLFLGDGKEILRASLEKKKGRQKFELKEPATFKELTFKVLSVYPGKAKFGAVNEIEAFDGNGRDVPLYRPRNLLSISPEQVASVARWMKKFSSRPVFLTLSPCFMKTESGWDQATKDKLYPEYVRHCDVAGVAVRPISDGQSPARRPDAADAVSELRALAGSRQPVYALIELPAGGSSKGADPGPKRIRAEVWMAIIRGATAIGYLTPVKVTSRGKAVHVPFAPQGGMRAELKRLNGRITRLARAILADPAKAKIEMKLVAGPGGKELASHFKATQLAGDLTIFAQNIDPGVNGGKAASGQGTQSRSGQATISVEALKAGTKIEVVGENRVITAEAGRFSGEFGPLAEHTYRIKL